MLGLEASWWSGMAAPLACALEMLLLYQGGRAGSRGTGGLRGAWSRTAQHTVADRMGEAAARGGEGGQGQRLL